MNRRRILSGIHRAIARKPINAVAWFNSQSFHQSTVDMPFERLSNADLNKAGAALLPPVERALCAYGCGVRASESQCPFLQLGLQHQREE